MMDQDKVVLDTLLRMMPFLAKSFEDIVITLSDREKYIYYKAGKGLDHKIKPGDPVKEGSMTDRAYKQKGFVMSNVGAEVFGMPYSAFGFPIFNSNREIIGGMVFCESVEMQEKQKLLKTISEEISGNMALMGENINSLVNKSEYINSTTENLLVQAQESQIQLQETNNIVNIIKAIAYKTNILGINAAIESTRVGKEGAGFKIVADEIRTLSISTDDAIKKIEPIIKQIHLNSENMTLKIDEINNNLASITDFINQTRAMARKLSESSETINNLADTLVKGAKQRD